MDTQAVERTLIEHAERIRREKGEATLFGVALSELSREALIGGVMLLGDNVITAHQQTGRVLAFLQQLRSGERA